MLYMSIEILSSFSGKIGLKRGWVYTSILLSIIPLLQILREFPKKKGRRLHLFSKNNNFYEKLIIGLNWD